jgi:CubicO group peptidase (beta-lactamase class C family)
MRPIQADKALYASMHQLVQVMGMLTGLTVCYGNRDKHMIASIALKQEVMLTANGFESAPEEITGNTVYDIASLTKLFTLVSVLQLAEQGVLRMEDSIYCLDSRFLRLQDCTVFDCLSYLACLRTPERVDTQADADAAGAMVFQTYRVPLEGVRLYSDMNALVLKYIVEKISGLPFEQYLARHILKPAGMEETWANVPSHRRQDLMNYNYEHKRFNGSYALYTDAFPGLPHDPKARLLKCRNDTLSGHAGLFSTAEDLCRFCHALLQGRLISIETLMTVGINRTGYLKHDGSYRQFLGLLCFTKSPVQRLSEVPHWMGLRAFGLSGYTGNHLAMDPDAGVFDVFLGNRCHNRFSLVIPEEDAAGIGLQEDGTGRVIWPDGRSVLSSFRYIHQKDSRLHQPVFNCLHARGWLKS